MSPPFDNPPVFSFLSHGKLSAMGTEGLPSQSRLRRASSPGGRAKFYLLEESFQILPWTPPSQSETAGETGRTKPPARWGQGALCRRIYRVVQLVGS